MALHQLQFLNLPQPSLSEAYVRKLAEAYKMARLWSQSATDSGLDGLLSAAGSRLLQSLVKSIAQRDVLSPALRSTVVDVADTCSRRSSERFGHMTSPEARAQVLEKNRPAEATLTEHVVQLYALADAIDEVLDLETALRRQREVLMSR